MLSLFKMNAGYSLMRLASERDKEHIYRLAGQHSRDDANGVPQVCFIGVVYPQNSRVETPDELQDDLILASKHILKERLGVQPGPATAADRPRWPAASPLDQDLHRLPSPQRLAGL